MATPSLPVLSAIEAKARKSETPHCIHVDITPRSISYAHCSCQAGVCGSCSHVVGLIIALQQWQMMGFTEVPSRLSCTSLPEQWSMPQGRKIEPVDVPHFVFVNPKPDRKKRPVTNTLTDCRNITVKHEDLDYLKTLTDCPISYLVFSPHKTIDTHVGPVPVASGLSTHTKFFEPESVKSVGTTCGNLVFPQPATVTLGENYHIEELTQEHCVKIEETTRDQASSGLWVQVRKNKLTASTFGSILKRKTVTDKFLKKIIDEEPFTSVRTSYGKNNEKCAIEQYIEKTGNHVHDCGHIVNRKFPFLGATPDGKVCENGNSGLIVVKCPYAARDMTIADACTNLPIFCLQNTDGTVSIRKDKHYHDHYYQIQGQLMVSGAAFCDYVVYTRQDLFIQRVLPNLEFMQAMLDELSEFYFQHVKPVLEHGVNLQLTA